MPFRMRPYLGEVDLALLTPLLNAMPQGKMGHSNNVKISVDKKEANSSQSKKSVIYLQMWYSNKTGVIN
jgi:hypothetical protein